MTSKELFILLSACVFLRLSFSHLVLQVECGVLFFSLSHYFKHLKTKTMVSERKVSNI